MGPESSLLELLFGKKDLILRLFFNFKTLASGDKIKQVDTVRKKGKWYKREMKEERVVERDNVKPC